jgi:hypothetical protein
MEIQEIKIVQSSVEPSVTEELQGKILVNFNIEEKTRIDNNEEEITYYEYYQISRPLGDTEDRIEKYTNYAKIQIMQEYLEKTDYISNKYQDEVILLGNLTQEEFIEKYQEVLNTRSTYRGNINKIYKNM